MQVCNNFAKEGKTSTNYFASNNYLPILVQAMTKEPRRNQKKEKTKKVHKSNFSSQIVSAREDVIKTNLVTSMCW